MEFSSPRSSWYLCGLVCVRGHDDDDCGKLRYRSIRMNTPTHTHTHTHIYALSCPFTWGAQILLCHFKQLYIYISSKNIYMYIPARLETQGKKVFSAVKTLPHYPLKGRVFVQVVSVGMLRVSSFFVGLVVASLGDMFFA